MSGKPSIREGLPAGLAEEGEWYISEFTSEDAGLTIKGRFGLSPFQKLNPEQTLFLMTFLRCRGVISSVEKELGISYPTVRSRLDALLAALGLAPAPDSHADRKRELTNRQREILQRLEAGEISADDAKKAMKEAAK